MNFVPQSGDVAYFVGCVEGGDPYRVTVSYRFNPSGWHNIQTGLRLDDTHPGLADLHLLVRDHHAVLEAAVRELADSWINMDIGDDYGRHRVTQAQVDGVVRMGEQLRAVLDGD